MAKDKKGTKAAAAAPVKDKKASKPIETVKAGRVTKSSDKKAGSKETAKKAAKEVEKSGKKSKKSKKEPTPSSSSSEEDDDSSDDSSNSESEAEAKPAPKANGKAKAAKKEETSDSSSSESDSSEDEAPAPKTNGTAKAAAKDDSSDSDSSSDDEEETKAGAADAEMKDASDSSDSSDSDESDSEEAPKPKANGAAKEDSSADSDDSDDSSDSDSEEEEKPKAEEKPSKKRKAETEAEPTTKKPKVMVNGEEKEATGNLFVGNLSWNIDEEWLTREFEEFGEIQGVRIITDKDSGRSKGFGYVEFTTPEAGAKALEARLGYELDGRELRVDFSAPRGEKSGFDNPRERQDARAARFGDTKNPPASTLFVGNISFDADESVLTEVFQEFGSINSIRLPTDRETGAPKGFGYVEMASTEEAQAAYDSLQGADVSGRPVRLDFAAPRADNGGGFRGGRGGGDRGGRGGGGFRGGRGGFGDRGGRGGGRGRGAPRGRGATTNRGGFGDFSGQKKTFD